MFRRSIVALLLLAAAPSFAEDVRQPEAMSSTQGGFQKTRWGMSKKQVRALYPGLQTASDGQIGHLTKFAGKDAGVLFYFLGDRLGRAVVMFTEREFSANAYLSRFEWLRDLLTKKYGEPTESGPIWHDRTVFADDPERLGTALSMGHVSLKAEWVLGDTRIIVFAGSKKPMNIQIGMLYGSVSMESEFDRKQESAQLADF